MMKDALLDWLRNVLAWLAVRLDNARINKPLKELIKSGQVVMGEYTYGTPIILNYKGAYENKVIIGKFCSIGKNVRIMLGGEHHVDWISTFPFRIKFNLPDKYSDGQPFSRGNTVIQNDVWIGNDVWIRDGVTIGHGAVIAAGAVIVKDVLPYEIVVGNPAKVIKKRFSEEQINVLLKTRWWDWPIDVVLSNVDLLCSNQIDKFFNKASKEFISYE